MSSSTFLGTGTCLGSFPLFWAWISARRRAAHLEDFPYSMLLFCAFRRSTLAVVVALFSTVVVVFSCTEVVLEDATEVVLEDATAADIFLAEALEEVKAASYLAAEAADALLSLRRAS